MPRRIRGPDGRILVVPDNATDAEIAEILGSAPATGDASGSAGQGEASGAVARLASLLPTIGGTLGGFAGGKVPLVSAGTAAVGGAAGQGYRQLAEHAGELLPAVADVARNVLTEPGATLRGATEGLASGLREMGTQAGVQGAAELAGGAVTRGVAGGAKAVYRGYLKPSLAARTVPKAEGIVQTALDEAHPIGFTDLHMGAVNQLRPTLPGL